MKKISVSEAKDSMVLGRDVVSLDKTKVLLARGAELDEVKIILLKREGIETIYIRSDEEIGHYASGEDAVAFSFDVTEESTQTKKMTAEEKSIRLDEIVTDMLEDCRNGKRLDRGQLSIAVDILMEEVSDGSNLFGLLRREDNINRYLINHSINVAIISIALSKWLRYSKVDQRNIALAGLLHDVGKVKISNIILDKPGKLTPSEFEIMKKHTTYGYNILKDTIGIGKSVLYGVLQHHEREDGSGYPLRLKGNQIHEYGKIIAISDVYDAMTTTKIYKQKENPFSVQEEIQREAFSRLDPGMTYVFLKNVSKLYIGKKALLSNGEQGEIVYINPSTPTKPVIRVREDYYVDLGVKKDITVKEMID